MATENWLRGGASRFLTYAEIEVTAMGTAPTTTCEPFIESRSPVSFSVPTVVRPSVVVPLELVGVGVAVAADAVPVAVGVAVLVAVPMTVAVLVGVLVDDPPP